MPLTRALLGTAAIYQSFKLGNKLFPKITRDVPYSQVLRSDHLEQMVMEKIAPIISLTLNLWIYGLISLAAIQTSCPVFLGTITLVALSDYVATKYVQFSPPYRVAVHFLNNMIGVFGLWYGVFAL